MLLRCKTCLTFCLVRTLRTQGKPKMQFQVLRNRPEMWMYLKKSERAVRTWQNETLVKRNIYWTELRKSLRTWFGEVYYCCCLPLLHQLAYNILAITYKDFFSALYCLLHNVVFWVVLVLHETWERKAILAVLPSLFGLFERICKAANTNHTWIVSALCMQSCAYSETGNNSHNIL